MQGAAAIDSIEGERSSEIAACKPAYKFDAYGLRGCALDTSRPGNHTITYLLEDPDAGVTHTVSRSLVVLPDCSGGDVCSNLQCASNGLCLSGTTLPLPTNAPPVMRFASGAAAARGVARGQRYVSCNQEPRPAALCEEGPTAHDPEDGDLTARVLACPPESCLWQGCPGHEFSEKGALRALQALRGRAPGLLMCAQPSASGLHVWHCAEIAVCIIFSTRREPLAVLWRACTLLSACTCPSLARTNCIVMQTSTSLHCRRLGRLWC